MLGKLLLYFLVTIIVIYALDSLNINHIFKKNKPTKAKIFYLLLAISLIYLVTNFIIDFTSITKII